MSKLQNLSTSIKIGLAPQYLIAFILAIKVILGAVPHHAVWCLGSLNTNANRSDFELRRKFRTCDSF